MKSVVTAVYENRAPLSLYTQPYHVYTIRRGTFIAVKLIPLKPIDHFWSFGKYNWLSVKGRFHFSHLRAIIRNIRLHVMEMQ